MTYADNLYAWLNYERNHMFLWDKSSYIPTWKNGYESNNAT